MLLINPSITDNQIYTLLYKFHPFQLLFKPFYLLLSKQCGGSDGWAVGVRSSCREITSALTMIDDIVDGVSPDGGYRSSINHLIIAPKAEGQI